MHDRAVVVADASGVGVLLNLEVELHSRIGRRVLRQHFEIIVAIGARLRIKNEAYFKKTGLISANFFD